jgi:hypothetical protein
MQHNQRFEHHIPTRHRQTTIEERHQLVSVSALNKNCGAKQIHKVSVEEAKEGGQWMKFAI